MVLLIMLSMSSCKWFKKKMETTAEPILIAEVGDKKLYYSDIKGIAEDMTPKDSSHIVETYVEDWVRHQLVLRQAEKNKNLYSDELDKQIRDYSESLMIYYYQNELIRAKIDSNITEKEILDYYQNHPNEFQLNTDIVKCAYIITELQAPLNDTIKQWLSSWDPNDVHDLQVFCDQYGSLCNLDNKTWISRADLYNATPIDAVKSGANAGVYVSQDSLYRYYVRIFQNISSGTNAPMDYVSSDIKMSIYNKKKVELFKNVYNKLYEDGIKSKAFEIHHFDKK